MFKFVVPIVAMLVANMPVSIHDVLYEAKAAGVETVLEGYKDLYESNSDMAGYIYLPNGIEYPVMFTPYNQNYYVDHDFNKAESREGLPFLNRYSVFGGRGISLMYGHHLKSGRGFTVLKDYLEDIEGARIQADTLYSEQEYEVVAAALTSLDESFSYYEYVGSLNKREFEAWKEGFEPYCVRGTLSELAYDDVILELSTCYYQKENGRLVVILKACK